MFKASIALVLIAFGALAYGWIAGNDAVLYGSIGASALAGLALLGSTRADRKSARLPPEQEALERGERRKERRPDAALSEARAGQRRRAGGLDPQGMTRRQDFSTDQDEEDFTEPVSTSVKPVPSPPRGRKRGPKVPEEAAWANEDELAEESGPPEQLDRDRAALESGIQPEQYPDEDLTEPAAAADQGAAADDFRSRLAAVLGSAGEQEPEPSPRPTPKPTRARRTSPAAAAPEPEAPKPAKRGRRKAQPAASEPQEGAEAEEEEDEPDWVRIDEVPRISSRATQPGGGFARPDAPQGMTPYRPRRPGIAQRPPGDEPPATPAKPRRRSTSAETAGSAKSEPAPAKRPGAGGKPSVKDVSGAAKPRTRSTKERDPDAPPARRGRPPKPKA